MTVPPAGEYIGDWEDDDERCPDCDGKLRYCLWRRYSNGDWEINTRCFGGDGDPGCGWAVWTKA